MMKQVKYKNIMLQNLIMHFYVIFYVIEKSMTHVCLTCVYIYRYLEKIKAFLSNLILKIHL